jgi:hypothetical protein
MGARRLTTELERIRERLDRRREEALSGLEQRVVEAQTELRGRLEAIAADSEAERAVLEARLHELSRRLDEALAAAQGRLAALRE